MHNSECIGRLVNSATHDLRNVLAVIRESTGLIQDILQQAHKGSGAGALGTCPPLPRPDRLRQALQSVQEQVSHGAELAEAMGYLGQCAEYRDEGAIPCDLTRITRDFCVMATRRGKACALELQCPPTAEPILSPVAPLEVFRALLNVFDVCVSVGGGVRVRFKPMPQARQQDAAVIACDVLDGGANTDMSIAALTGHPLLSPHQAGWTEKILKGGVRQRFVLRVEATF